MIPFTLEKAPGAALIRVVVSEGSTPAMNSVFHDRQLSVSSAYKLAQWAVGEYQLADPLRVYLAEDPPLSKDPGMLILLPRRERSDGFFAAHYVEPRAITSWGAECPSCPEHVIDPALEVLRAGGDVQAFLDSPKAKAVADVAAKRQARTELRGKGQTRWKPGHVKMAFG